MNKINLYIKGIHCNSCKILIEDILNERDDLDNVFVDSSKETLSFSSNKVISNEEWITILNKDLLESGYSLHNEKLESSGNFNWKALPFGIGVLVIFFLIQKSGILNFGLGENVNALTSFIIGLIASISSCLAVVGGLVLSLSATVSQDRFSDIKPIALFHISRIVGFGILGGLLGSLGAFIGINFTISSILGILSAIIMIVLGLNLVGFFKKNLTTLPAGFFNKLRRVENNSMTPVIIGAGTFFLPCGFTQAMQFAAIASGSFTSGMIIMASFALGTLPVLSILSFGSNSLSKSNKAPFVFGVIGFVVIGLGLFTLLSGLVALGVLPPLFNI